MAKLDRSKPYAYIVGICDWKYVQNGKKFLYSGEEYVPDLKETASKMTINVTGSTPENTPPSPVKFEPEDLPGKVEKDYMLLEEMSDEALRLKAKKAKIRSYWNKKRERLIRELKTLYE